MNPEKLQQSESPVDGQAKKLESTPRQEIVKQLADKNIKTPESSQEYSKETYEKDKNLIFDFIRSGNGFQDKDEYYFNTTGSTKKGEEFVKENYMMLAKPEQIRAWLILKNNQISKNEYINTTDKSRKTKVDPPINVEAFMKTFVAEQEQIRTKYVEKKIIREVVEIKPSFQEGVVGEFVELSPKDKSLIVDNLNKVLEFDQDIQNLTITGKADATRPQTWEKLHLQAEHSLQRLREHGFDEKLLNTIELSNGNKIAINDVLKETNDPNKLNTLWAFNRALMQIDFLDKEQIGLLNTSLKSKILLDAQEVNGPNKGNEFTGGAITIDTKGNERIEKQKIELPLKELNSPLAFFHININLDEPGNMKTGFLELVYKDHALRVGKYANKASLGLDDSYDRNNSHLATYQTAFPDYGNPTLNLDLSSKDVGFDGAKAITSDMPNGQKNLTRYENISGYYTKAKAFFDTIQENPEEFIRLLTLYKNKTTKPEEQKYLDGVIQTIRALAS